MAQEKLKSALMGLPSQMQRPRPRPMQPGATRPIPKQPTQGDFRNLPSSRPMPRPAPVSPGQAAGAIAGQQSQPAFRPFPRPINAPGQRPDMFAGGSPNFDESTGQYRPQQMPNVQDAFQQAYQQYRPVPMQQQDMGQNVGQLAQQQEADRFAQQQAMAAAQQRFPTYQPQPFNPYRKF